MNVEKHHHRVLNVIASLEAGGIQSLVMNIYRHIDRSKIQFDFAVREQRQNFFDKEILELGGRIFRLPWRSGNPLSLITYKKAFRQVLVENGPYIAVHSHTNFFSGLVVTEANKANIPLRIAHSHSISEWDNSFVRRNIWMPLMRKQILTNATHLFACSSDAAEWLYGETIQQDPRFKIVYNGVYLDDFKRHSDSGYDLRKELSLSNNAILLGHIGRFDYVKNHRFLIELFAEFVKTYSDAHLVLVGDGHLRSQIETLVSVKGLAGNVHFLGIRSDVPEILKNLNIFILPSYSEGLPLVSIEAQISGTPCVVSDVVPKEADLNLGIMKFVSLQAGEKYWIKQIQDALELSIPSWSKRESILKSAGYDIEMTIKQLQKIYLSNNL